MAYEFRTLGLRVFNGIWVSFPDVLSAAIQSWPLACPLATIRAGFRSGRRCTSQSPGITRRTRTSLCQIEPNCQSAVTVDASGTRIFFSDGSNNLPRCMDCPASCLYLPTTYSVLTAVENLSHSLARHSLTLRHSRISLPRLPTFTPTLLSWITFKTNLICIWPPSPVTMTAFIALSRPARM